MSEHQHPQPESSGNCPVPIYVIGMGLPGDTRGCCHPILERADVLIGGKAVLSGFQEHPAEKLVVDADMASLYERISLRLREGKALVALCSGDPLFFGLGARLVERFGASSVRIVPGISSMQAAAALLGLPWEDICTVSLHGRSGFFSLARALYTGLPIFLLCDAKHTPARIADWLRERGCTGYRMHVLENLFLDASGIPGSETSVCLQLEEVVTWQIARDGERRRNAAQCVVFLLPDREPAVFFPSGESSKVAEAVEDSSQPCDGSVMRPEARPFGLNDRLIAKERNLVTKLPIRAAGLAFLGIKPRSVVWDLGAGSGAVSVEAARLAWQGRVFAVEKNTERVALIEKNRRQLSVPNLEIVAGTLPDCLDSPERSGLSRPDRIFIGGGLGSDTGAARRLISLAWEALLPGGRLLAHCVLLSSLELSRELLSELARKCDVNCIQTSQSTPLGGDMRLEALNPIFLVLACKPEHHG